MKTILRFAAVAVVMAAAVSPTYAASIGVNFGDGNPSNEGLLTSGQSAGVVSQTNWMNVSTPSATGLALTDNAGLATTAALTFASGSGYPIIQTAAFVDDTNGDEKLNNSYIYSGSPFVFTITGVPYATYNLITYVNSIFTGRPLSTTVGATTLWGLGPNPTSAGYVDGNTGTSYTYISAVGATSGTATPNGNYFLFSGLTGSTLTFTMSSTTDLPQLTAFQIVDAVPEPGSAVLMLGGLCALGLRRMRAKQ